MSCIAKTASCRTLSPASIQLNKLVAAGEIPDSAYACITVVYFPPASCIQSENFPILPEIGLKIGTERI